ncbi:MAG: SMI1/KNR4 family protein [Fuerstiella sp.]|nr:SMI1/KNR4 family protein [Fuerstiella sp.]
MSDPLIAIQKLTGFSLRDDYKQLLDNFPSQLINVTRADDGSEREGLVSSVELMSDSADVLDVNHEVRSGSVMHPDGNDFQWPDQVLVIGENGEGDYYCIDSTGKYSGVLLFDHQLVEFEEIAGSLSEYIELLLESFPA